MPEPKRVSAVMCSRRNASIASATTFVPSRRSRSSTEPFISYTTAKGTLPPPLTCASAGVFKGAPLFKQGKGEVTLENPMKAVTLGGGIARFPAVAGLLAASTQPCGAFLSPSTAPPSQTRRSAVKTPLAPLGCLLSDQQTHGGRGEGSLAHRAPTVERASPYQYPHSEKGIEPEDTNDK